MFSTVKSELKFREDRLSSYEKRINSKVDSAETSVVTNQASEMAAYGPHECFGMCLTLFLLARPPESPEKYRIINSNSFTGTSQIISI